LISVKNSESIKRPLSILTKKHKISKIILIFRGKLNHDKNHFFPINIRYVLQNNNETTIFTLLNELLLSVNRYCNFLSKLLNK
jgi:vacuolar-type H+-ATPase subunit C/Vma6